MRWGLTMQDDHMHSATMLVLAVLLFLFLAGCMGGLALGWLIWR